MRFLSGHFRRHSARPDLLKYIIDGISDSLLIVSSNMTVVNNPSAADDNDPATQTRTGVAEELSEVFDGVALHIPNESAATYHLLRFLLSSCLF